MLSDAPSGANTRKIVLVHPVASQALALTCSMSMVFRPQMLWPTATPSFRSQALAVLGRFSASLELLWMTCSVLALFMQDPVTLLG